MKALYSGSFDPLTNGHIHVINTATKIFDELFILVSVNSPKKSLFSVDERIEALNHVTEPEVYVDFYDGLVIDYVQSNNVEMIVRGLRNTNDFNEEEQIRAFNYDMQNDIEQIYIPASFGNLFISSTAVKEVWKHRGINGIKEIYNLDWIPEATFNLFLKSF